MIAFKSTFFPVVDEVVPLLCSKILFVHVRLIYLSLIRARRIEVI